MKKIHEMSHDEIIALATKDIDRLIDLACAEAGVPLLDELPPEPKAPEWDDNINAFKIGSMVFADRESAEIVQSCLTANAKKILEFSYGKVRKDTFAISECIHVTPDQEKQRASAESAFKIAKNEWSALEDKYREMTTRRAELATPIFELYDRSVKKEGVKKMLIREADRYYALSEQQGHIAIGFLRLAYADALAAVEDIFDPSEYFKRLDDALVIYTEA